MSQSENPMLPSGSGVAVDSDETAVPSGNLFATPGLTVVDPADKTERRGVERLLAALDDPR